MNDEAICWRAYPGDNRKIAVFLHSSAWSLFPDYFTWYLFTILTSTVPTFNILKLQIQPIMYLMILKFLISDRKILMTDKYDLWATSTHHSNDPFQNCFSIILQMTICCNQIYPTGFTHFFGLRFRFVPKPKYLVILKKEYFTLNSFFWYLFNISLFQHN